MVCGMPSISLSKNEICKGCMLGKNIKKSFPSSDNRAQGILDLVHSDVCVPMSSPSLNGCLYYVIFIDDYSRKCWIYFLKDKSDTFDKFKEYKSFIEKQTRNTSEPLEQIMEESLNLSSLRIFARKQESRDS
jgi:hypothetical protein